MSSITYSQNKRIDQKSRKIYLDNKTMNRKEFVAHKGMDNKFNICLRIKTAKSKTFTIHNRADVIKYANNERVITRYAHRIRTSSRTNFSRGRFNNLSPDSIKFILEDDAQQHHFRSLAAYYVL